MGKFRIGSTTAAKLTPEKVLQIRERYAKGETQGSLAREFGVGVGQIGRIVRGEAWQQYTEVLSESDIMHRDALAGRRPLSEEQLMRDAEASMKRFAAMQASESARTGEGGIGLAKLNELAEKIINVDELLDELKETHK